MSEALWIPEWVKTIVMFAGILFIAIPGILAYQKASKHDNSELLELQVKKLSDEIVRLQIMTDKQQVKINELSVEISNQRIRYESLASALRRLAEQVRDLGHEPIVDPERLLEILTK